MANNSNYKRLYEVDRDNKILPLQPAANTENAVQSGPEKSAVKPAETSAQALKRRWSEAAGTTKRIADSAAAPDVQLQRLPRVDEDSQRLMLEQMNAAAQEQAARKSDYAVEQGVNELKRAEEDAAEKYRAERNRISADELRALDDQALYAETRGDRGGIGQAQYGAIRNTAAINRMAVDREQMKLSTDTARQIADLRAKGEFEKADKLLEITQSHLSELMSLRRWAEETNMDADEFNAKLAQWEADYALNANRYRSDTELAAARLTGALADGTPTLEAQEQFRTQLAQAGEAMMQQGITPTDAQLEAMGWTKEQYELWLANRANAASAAESARLTGPIYIRNDKGELQRVTKREYREYLAARQ